MTQEVFLGRAPILPSMPAAGSSWRGLSISLSTDFPYEDVSGADPIPFDTIDWDTDAIYNGTDGGIVPVGMAGAWMLSGQVQTASTTPISGHGSMLYCKNGLGGVILRTSYYAFNADVMAMTFPFAAFAVELAEGDEIQILAGSTGGGSPSAYGASNCWLTMRYLGPVPEVS